MHTDNYTEKSLELHLFFGRIMKEHALFLKAGFTPANASFSGKAEFYKTEFEKLLGQAVSLSEGIISRDVLCSGELVTKYTAEAEKKTSAFTGISINGSITRRQLILSDNCVVNKVNGVHRTDLRIRQLNRRALMLLDGLISFKENVLRNVLKCGMFTGNYPLLIEHIIREAKLYREYVEILEREGDLTDLSMRDTECFWNRIMMEHAMFIRGLLDPSESELIASADGFAKEYSELLEECNSAHRRASGDSLEQTIRFRDFKMAGVQGITDCSIRSVILPLLADHVLREANHYIRLLEA